MYYAIILVTQAQALTVVTVTKVVSVVIGQVQHQLENLKVQTRTVGRRPPPVGAPAAAAATVLGGGQV